MSATAVGAQLTVDGTGYTRGSSYGVDMTWPSGGTGQFAVTADSNGAWHVASYAYWSGTYTVNVLSAKGRWMNSCSATVS